jgi:phenylacetate-CoA ligase
MIIRGVNVFPTQIEELILRQPDLAPHYVCIITRSSHLDELEVRVEMTLRFVHAGSDAHHAVTRQLTSDIKNLIGVSANVELTLPGTIERSLGKAKRVIDKRRMRLEPPQQSQPT